MNSPSAKHGEENVAAAASKVDSNPFSVDGVSVSTTSSIAPSNATIDNDIHFYAAAASLSDDNCDVGTAEVARTPDAIEGPTGTVESSSINPVRLRIRPGAMFVPGPDYRCEGLPLSLPSSSSQHEATSHERPGVIFVPGPNYRAGGHPVSSQQVESDEDVPEEAEVHHAPAYPEAWAVDDDVAIAVAMEREQKSRIMRFGLDVCAVAAYVIAAALLIQNNGEGTPAGGVASPKMAGFTSNTDGAKFAVHAPPMPSEVSEMLAVKHMNYKYALLSSMGYSSSCRLSRMGYSSDCSVVAISLADEWDGVVRTTRYDRESDQWTLLDGEIDEGNSSGDRFGNTVELSKDGMVMAVGMPRDDPNSIIDAGSVRVYCRMCAGSDRDDKWVPMGPDIHGVDPDGWMGTTISLSADGSMIATGAPYGAGGAGRATVHRFDTSKKVWKQVGSDIVGEGNSSTLTFVVLSAEGNTLGTGSQEDDTTGVNAGSARIFRLDETTEEWIQLGDGIYGDAAGALYGGYPHLSKDGQTVAITGLFGAQAGIYKYHSDEDEWIQLGENFVKGGIMNLSQDGKRCIFCSIVLNNCAIYSFDGNAWNETEVFDPDGFVPTSFSRYDGREACGIGIRPSDATDAVNNVTTIAFYRQFD